MNKRLQQKESKSAQDDYRWPIIYNIIDLLQAYCKEWHGGTAAKNGTAAIIDLLQAYCKEWHGGTKNGTAAHQLIYFEPIAKNGTAAHQFSQFSEWHQFF